MGRKVSLQVYFFLQITGVQVQAGDSTHIEQYSQNSDGQPGYPHKKQDQDDDHADGAQEPV
jgi:hypothetical protein